MSADGELFSGIVYGLMVLLFGQERADRWWPKVPYIYLTLLVVTVLLVFGTVMILL